MLQKNKKHLIKHRLTLNISALWNSETGHQSLTYPPTKQPSPFYLVCCFTGLYFIRQKNSSPLVSIEFIQYQRRYVSRKVYTDHFAIAEAFIDKLIMLYKKHYEPLLPSGDASLSYTYLNTVLEYSFIARDDCIWDQYQHFIEDDSLRKLCLAKDFPNWPGKKEQDNQTRMRYRRQTHLDEIHDKWCHQAGSCISRHPMQASNYWRGRLKMTEAMDAAGKKLWTFV